MEPHRNHWQVDTDLLHLGSMYSHPLDTQLYNDRPLCEIMGDLSSKDVIDIGCGNGYLSRKVAKQARTVMGIDSSQEMIDQAIIQSEGIDNLHYQAATVASPENLPFPDEAFDVALCSLTVNNVASTEMMKRAFREIARVVKSRGLLALSLPHPLTLDATSKFRWTEWEPQQSQTILVPGEDFLRKLMVGKGAEMFAVRNYYWPPDVLKNLAQHYGLVPNVSSG